MNSTEPGQYVGCSVATTGADIMQMIGMGETSLTDRVFVITGANGAMATQISKVIVKAGGTAVMLCRTSQKCDGTKAHIIEELGKSQAKDLASMDDTKAHIGNLMDTSISMDLASMQSVRAAADKISEGYGTSGVHAVLHIAAVRGKASMDPTMTRDGFQLTMQVNILAPALLSDLLLPSLIRAEGRVINVASINAFDFEQYGMQVPEPDQINALSRKPPRQWYYYSLSKFLMVHHAVTFAERYGIKKVAAFSVSPGYSRDDELGCMESKSQTCSRNTKAMCDSSPKFQPCPQSSGQSSAGIVFAALAEISDSDNGAMIDYDRDRHGAQSGLSCRPQTKPLWNETTRNAWFEVLEKMIAPWKP